MVRVRLQKVANPSLIVCMIIGIVAFAAAASLATAPAVGAAVIPLINLVTMTVEDVMASATSVGGAGANEDSPQWRWASAEDKMCS